MFDRNNGSMFSGGVGTALREDCLSDMFVCAYRLFRVLFGGVRYILLGDDSGIEFVEDGISGVLFILLVMVFIIVWTVVVMWRMMFLMLVIVLVLVLGEV